jgi:uncharacterized protein involved in exopolysaccharide biosynthesis
VMIEINTLAIALGIAVGLGASLFASVLIEWMHARRRREP